MFSSTQIQAQCNHSTSKSKGNFLPFVRLIGTPVFICEDSAVSLMAELGPRNYRVNATLGYISDDTNRFKVTIEHLSQRLKYNFSTGNVHRWMHQLALGGKWEYIFDCGDYLRGLDLGANWSYSKGRSLRTNFCEEAFAVVHRKIAGAWSFSFAGGGIFTPWECGRFIVKGFYDHVVYNRSIQKKKRSSGVGIGLYWNQLLWRSLVMDLTTEFRRPYNYFEGKLSWFKKICYGDLSFGVFAAHETGKDKLPDVNTAGIEIGFAFGVDDCCRICDYDACIETTSCATAPCDLAVWVAEPAVYMPVVYAIPDQEFADCTPPESRAIQNQTYNPGPWELDVGDNFRSTADLELTYSATGLPPDASIDPKSGEITGNNPGFTAVYVVTVTATDDCGFASETFTITYNGIGPGLAAK
jgi:hypothetical protein